MWNHDNHRLLLGSIILIVSSLAAVLVAVTLLYQVALEEKREGLIVSARSQARLIEEIARHDRYLSRWVKDEIPNYDPLEASLHQVIAAHNAFKGFGETGEFVLAQKVNEQIVFRFRHNTDNLTTPKPAPLDARQAVPMRRALSGESGFMFGTDYEGDAFLAAYEPVSDLNLGIVAKIDLSEVRAPFIQATLIACALTLTLIAASVILLRRTFLPVFKKLQNTTKKLSAEIELNQQVLSALQAKETFYQSIFDNIQAGVLHLSKDGRILRVNNYIEEMLGYTAPDLQQMTLAQITFPDDLQASEEMLQQLGQGKTGSYSLAKRYLTKEGAPVWGLASVSLQSQMKGGEAYIAVVQNIDEFKHQQDEVTHAAQNLESVIQQRTKELQQRVDEVEQLNQAIMNLANDLQLSNRDLDSQREKLATTNADLESFSYSVSHDLRAPLRHISGFVTILQESAVSNLDEATQKHLKTIADSAEKMGQMIDDLLSFSRAGRSELVMAPIDMNLLFQEVRTVIDADYSPLKVNWTIGPLPEVHGDVSSLRQVVVNLLDNAVKYSSKKTTPMVEVSAQREGPEVIFKIQDNGVGFNPTYEEKLFKVFHRLHRDDEFGGTGIGLASVRRIVKRHGGRVKGESQLGQGACFYFILPERPGNEDAVMN